MTLLGAAEADFQNTDGTAKSAWQAYITRFRAIERDENGELPEIHQATVYDPSVFTKVLDMRASQMGSMVAAPPQDLGLYTQGNPTSAKSGEVQEKRRNRRAKLMQKQFGPDAGRGDADGSPVPERRASCLSSTGGWLPTGTTWTRLTSRPLRLGSRSRSRRALFPRRRM